MSLYIWLTFQCTYTHNTNIVLAIYISPQIFILSVPPFSEPLIETYTDSANSAICRYIVTDATSTE